jgi:hypothetical protein
MGVHGAMARMPCIRIQADLCQDRPLIAAVRVIGKRLWRPTSVPGVVRVGRGVWPRGAVGESGERKRRLSTVSDGA